MSNDPNAAGAPGATPEPLQFDKAEFTATPALSCAVCKTPIAGEYFQVNGQTVCSGCRSKLESSLAGGSSSARAFKAFGAGAAAGIAGFVIYWAIRAATGYEFALVAILIGWMVGVAVRWGSQQRGGWFYQSMAIGLTYFSIASSYTPDVLTGLRQGRAEQGAQPPEAAATNQVETPTNATTTNAIAAAQGLVPFSTDYPELQQTHRPGDLLLAFIFSLAVPFLMGFDNLIGILIIAFGLMQAWRLNKRPVLNFSGPFSAGTPPSPAP